MSRFDIKQVHLMLNERVITGFTSENNAIDYKYANDAGEYAIGAHGAGVFVANPNESTILTIRLLQHHPDNAWLSQQRALQRKDLKSFTPMALIITDLMNADVATGSRGFFTALPAYTRGAQHNANVFTIAFETGSMNLMPGIDN
ncbi:phage protein [Erwinia sp. HR93]|uniref:phage protein n=1 Tax=Erwinia sp. HR93 TaxID=3094840 RepID=UPI002ADEBCFF|nr:phage protein [Erwinia sp. HR93]MEA1064746.1 phage protein [Erwinia sp. HR93]